MSGKLEDSMWKFVGVALVLFAGVKADDKFPANSNQEDFYDPNFPDFPDANLSSPLDRGVDIVNQIDTVDKGLPVSPNSIDGISQNHVQVASSNDEHGTNLQDWSNMFDESVDMFTKIGLPQSKISLLQRLRPVLEAHRDEIFDSDRPDVGQSLLQTRHGSLEEIFKHRHDVHHDPSTLSDMQKVIIVFYNAL